MTNEELKLISASNIINLRRAKGLTQAELGAVINYSDKTISKWERGETIPDAFVLTQLASYFGVDVDYMLSSHDDWELPGDDGVDREYDYDSSAVIAVVLLGILTATVTAFVTCWLLGIFEWRILLLGVTCMAITYFILDVTIKKSRHIKLSLSLLICSVFVLTYFALQRHKPWQIFLILGPAIVLAIVATEIKKKKSSTNGRAKK